MSDVSEQLKEKSSELLVKMIDFSIQSASDVVEFSKQQIPQVIHELLMWRATNAAIWMLVGIVILIGMWKAFKAINKCVKDTGEDDNYIMHIGTALLAIIGLGFFLPNLLELLQILVAPKVYLIEYSADLIKKS